MMRRGIVLVATLVALLSTARVVAQVPLLAPAGSARPEDLKGKILMIRGFYGGANLRFDERGALLEGGAPESWTLAGMEITDVKREGKQIEIRGRRVALVYDNGSKRFRAVQRKVMGTFRSKPDAVTVTIDVLAGDDAAAIKAVQRVFLTGNDYLADMVPQYWRSVVSKLMPAASAEQPPLAKADQPATTAQAEPATNVPARSASAPAEEGRPVPPDLPPNTYRVGGGVTAPKVISDQDPKYDQAARVARFQGTSVLRVVVDSRGSVRDVEIAKPLGFGLDDKAVEAVRGWRFKPATKNGQPVAVEITVEVGFRLY